MLFIIGRAGQLRVAKTSVSCQRWSYQHKFFTVSQRTREIAVRTALGARPLRVVSIVVSRALLQLVIGVALGIGLAAMVIPKVMNSFTMADNWRQMLARFRSP